MHYRQKEYTGGVIGNYFNEMYHPHMYMMYGGWGPLSFIGQLIGWIVFFVVLIAVIKFIARHKNHQWFKEDSATQILKERYAKGEITKEQFETMKKDLQ